MIFGIHTRLIMGTHSEFVSRNYKLRFAHLTNCFTKNFTIMSVYCILCAMNYIGSKFQVLIFCTDTGKCTG